MELDTESRDSVDAEYNAQYQVTALLQGFTPKREQEAVGHFLKKMIDDWDIQLKKQITEKKNADLENDADIIQAMLDEIQDQEKEKKSLEPKTIETVSVLKFVTEYCENRVSSFNLFYYKIENDIRDNCKSVVTEIDLLSLDSSKAEKKLNNAAKEYAYYPTKVCVLFDTTFFGSGKTGFCFTSSFVVFKDIGSYPHEQYYYRDIDDIGVNDEEFYIKGMSTKGSRCSYMKYNDYKVTRSLKIVCKCVMDYTSQPAFQIMSYLKNNIPIN